MSVAGAGKGGGEAVLKRLSSKDRTLAELHMRRVDLSLRHIPVSPAAPGCIISSERGQSFRRWLYRWIRQTLERCPHGAAPPPLGNAPVPWGTSAADLPGCRQGSSPYVQASFVPD